MCIDLNNMADREMLKDVVNDVLTKQLIPINKSLNSLSTEVEYIKKRTDEINGKVKKHEETLSEMEKADAIHIVQHENYIGQRTHTCPQLGRIGKLEKRAGIQIGVKQFVIAFFSFLLLLATLTFTVLRINEQFEDKKIEKIIRILENKEE